MEGDGYSVSRLVGGTDVRLMAAPFEENEGWEMTAVALNGTVYVEYYEPIEAKRAK